MDEIISKVREMLAARGLELDGESISFFIERFGVKSPEEVDDDFIEIIISQCQEPTQEQQQPKDIGGLRERINQLADMAEAKVNLETDRIAQLYKDVPQLVKSKVLGELTQQAEKSPDQSLVDFKNIAEFWTIFAQDSINNRQLTVLIFRAFVVIVLCLIAFNWGELHAKSRKDQTRIQAQIDQLKADTAASYGEFRNNERWCENPATTDK